MARKAANASRESEREERELANAVNSAIASTEDEIFADAVNGEPLDDSGDTSLEDMGEGLEGDNIDDEEQDSDEGDEGDEGDDEGDEGDGDEPEPEPEPEQPQKRPDEPPRAEQRGRSEDRPEHRGVPPRVVADLRERSRNVESENETLRNELRRVNDRLDLLMRGAPQAPPQGQMQTPQQQQPPAPQKAPDMFADPEGYQRWMNDELDRRANTLIGQRLQEQEQQRRTRDEQRLNVAFEQTARGVRGYEFSIAYNDFLTELHGMQPSPARDSLLQSVIQNPKPGEALLEWWEQTSNPDYVEHHREQIRQTYASQQTRPARGGSRHANAGSQQQPRHEVRLPPSLNSAVGGARQHSGDGNPEGSDSAVFDSIWR